MRILFVLEYYPPHIGGVESLFETIARGLVERGHEVRVLTTQLSGYKRKETLDRVRVERIRIPFDSRGLFAIWALARTIPLARWADVIHTSTFMAVPAASIAGMLTRTPVLITGHERIGKRWFSLPRVSKLSAMALYLTEHALYRFPAARIIAVSDATRRDIIAAGIRAEKVTRIYNAFDERAWTDPSLAQRTEALEKEHDLEDKTVFVVYGRPGVTKGIEYAVEAFERIRAYLSNAKLVLITGRTPAAGYRDVSHVLDRIGREHVIERNDLAFDELPAYVNLADVVIVPSLTEGFGYTTLESATLHKRIVASNVGAIPEVIFGRYRLIDPRDPEAIAHACVAITKKPPEASAPKRFPARSTIEAYEAEYTRIAGSPTDA